MIAGFNLGKDKSERRKIYYFKITLKIGNGLTLIEYLNCTKLIFFSVNSLRLFSPIHLSDLQDILLFFLALETRKRAQLAIQNSCFLYETKDVPKIITVQKSNIGNALQFVF